MLFEFLHRIGRFSAFLPWKQHVIPHWQKSHCQQYCCFFFLNNCRLLCNNGLLAYHELQQEIIAGDGHCHVQHSEKQLKIPYFLSNALARVTMSYQQTASSVLVKQRRFLKLPKGIAVLKECHTKYTCCIPETKGTHVICIRRGERNLGILSCSLT